MATPVCLLALLAGCGISADGRPVAELASPMARPPAALAAACARPVELPEGAMSAGAIERYWARDRAALAACASRHAAAMLFYDNRDRALAGR